MTHAELLEMFVYEPDTGMLRRVVGGRKPYSWRPIGKGYRYRATTIKGVTYYLHQLVWFYHTGEFPERVDHRDRNTLDSRIENLRSCTEAQNQYNSKRKINNRSGFKGVVFHKKCKTKPWQAKIVVAGKVVSLGYHATSEEAGAAYASGAKRYAGEFARADH